MAIAATEAQALLESKKLELTTVLAPFLEAVKDEVELAIENVACKCCVSMASIPTEWRKSAINAADALGYTTIYLADSQVLWLVF
jgi:hypothetical protein